MFISSRLIKGLLILVAGFCLLGPAHGQSNAITIASFNIQVFGEKKMENPEVVDVLVQIIKRYDIVAVQEIRNKSGQAIKDLERIIDAMGDNYDVIVGPRLGRTKSKEQYAFIYRVNTITPIGKPYTYVETGQDIIHREPLIARFNAMDDFDFILINSHVDKDDVVGELGVFPAIVEDVRNKFPHEKDIVILGDLNTDCTYFDESQYIEIRNPNLYEWLITDQMDTNVADNECTYDRIIVSKEMYEHFTNVAGVLRFDQLYSFQVPPKEVSDHYPVYAEFNSECKE